MPRKFAVFVIAFLIVVVLAFLVIRPLVNTILAAAVFAYLFHPLYRRINEQLMRDRVSALLVTFLIVAIIVLPVLLMINLLTSEFIQIVALESQPECDKGIVCNLVGFLKGISPEFSGMFSTFINSLVSASADYIASSVSSLFISVSSTLFHLSLLFFMIYYFLKDGKGMLAVVVRAIPVRDDHKNDLVQKVESVTYAMIYGNFVVAIIQGFVAFFGFWLLGVSNPVLWSLVTVFASLIPVLGAFVIWFPASLLVIANGYISGDTSIILKGVLLFLYGLLIISTIDNIIRPKLVGDRANVHPVTILVGIVGGVSLFGFVGLILGPLILSIFLIFLDLAEKEGLF